MDKKIMVKCVGVIIYDISKNMFLLQQRSRTSTYALKWGLWGGKLEENENFTDALKRELLEEISVNVDIKDIKPLDMFVSADGSFVYSSFVLVTDKLENLKISEIETNDYVWLPLESILKIDLHPATKNVISDKYHILEKVVKDYNIPT